MHNISISGIHLDLTETIKANVTHKMQKLFRHAEGIQAAKIELECAHHKHNPTEFIAKGLLSLRGPDLFVSCSTDNLYKSIDFLIDKLDRKLRRRSLLSKCKRKDCHKVDIPATLPKAA